MLLRVHMFFHFPSSSDLALMLCRCQAARTRTRSLMSESQEKGMQRNARLLGAIKWAVGATLGLAWLCLRPPAAVIAMPIGPGCSCVDAK